MEDDYEITGCKVEGSVVLGISVIKGVDTPDRRCNFEKGYMEGGRRRIVCVERRLTEEISGYSYSI